MEPWLPVDPDIDPPDPDDRDPNPPVAFVATQDPVPLRVTKVPDDRTPDGMVCMGTFLEEQDQLIARSAVPPDMLSDLESSGAFGEPVRLALAAVERDPGLQCRLFALIPAEFFREDEQEPEEPWAVSVPRFEDAEREQPPENGVVPLLLGHIVRFRRDRKHPDDLAREAGDVLRTILADEPNATDIVDKLLEELLDDTPQDDH